MRCASRTGFSGAPARNRSTRSGLARKVRPREIRSAPPGEQAPRGLPAAVLGQGNAPAQVRVGDQGARPQRPNPLEQRLIGVGEDVVQVGEAAFRQCRDQCGIDIVGVALVDAVDRDSGRDSHTDALGADRVRDRFDHFTGETDAVGHGPAVGVGALIGVLRQELVQQITVRAVNLHPRESGRDGVAGGGHEIGDGGFDVGGGHLQRDNGILRAAGRVNRFGQRDRRGRDRRQPAVVRMTDATAVL